VAHLEYENIVASERGLFEVQHGRMMAHVLRPEIKAVRLIQSTSANRPVAEGVIGTCLAAIGLYAAVSWILGRMAFSDYLIALLAAGPIGAAMLYDVLRRRFVLLVDSEGATRKLAFSTRADREEIEHFCKAIQETYNIPIEAKFAAQKRRS
jgi:hypothetical protein